jgi:hypothetical protein
VTEEQFKQILDGADEASKAELYRLAGLLRAAAAVGNDPSPSNITDLVLYASKVGYDMTRKPVKNG